MTRKIKITILLIILASFGVAFYFYPKMPDTMASHWNAKGQVDGYMSKYWGLFLMPFISLLMALLLVLIPKIDPLKENIVKFRKYFDTFVVLILLFLLYIYSLTIVWNLGKTFNMTYAMLPAFAVLFYYAGVLVEKAKRNWFVGIRTPWTLTNEEVWDKTHRMGGKLFKISAVISLFGLLSYEYAFWFVLVPIILMTVYLFIYSYFEFQKIKRNGKS
ncbi:MAG: SdpI family protein [Candidatus Pacebacteria bacterium]|nr:SdpI family protein [Candidatus Paceibacterota bacterium]